MKNKVGQSEFHVSLGTGQDCEIHIHKDQREQHPIYQQIADEIIRLVREGLLEDGSRLPTVRSLAEQLAVTRVTVHSAYSELRTRGWADAVIGRGTFVTCPEPRVPKEALEVPAMARTPDQVMADLSVLKERSDLISLAMAEPDPSLLPAEEFVKLLATMSADPGRLLSYAPYQGELRLRQQLAAMMRDRKLSLRPDDIIITSGVTQGLSMILAALCDKGDKVLVEQPTYLGFLNLIKTYDLQPVGLPLQKDGPCLKTLKELLVRERPRLYYSIPSFQNPSGVSYSQEKREALLELASQYDLLIIEDDVYGSIDFSHIGKHKKKPTPSLKSLDTEGRVIYLSSFSKQLFPGLRIGWMVPPAMYQAGLVHYLRSREFCGVPLLQEALATYLQRGLLRQHLQRVLPIYKRRRDVMLDTLRNEMPAGVEWSQPEGGFCCWLTLPEQVEFEEVYQDALADGVAVTPGSVFFLDTGEHHHLRLCYSTQNEVAIKEAISVLGKAIRKQINRTTSFPIQSGRLPVV